MGNKLGEIVTLIILGVALVTSVFLLYAYGSLLDFFPWGDASSYVIWESLVLYFIVPLFILIGCAVILFGRLKDYTIIGLHLFLIGLGFTVPSIFGFDLETDLTGRWCGIVVAMVALVLIIRDIVKLINRKRSIMIQ